MFHFLLIALLGCSGSDKGPPTYTGSIEVTQVDVAPIIPGRLEEIAVRRGDRVSKGDKLFTLDAQLIEVQREAALGAVEMASAAIETTKAQARAGDAQVKLLARELERMRSLEAAGAGTAQATSQLDGQLSVAKAQTSAAREGIGQARAGLSQAESAVKLIDESLSEASGYSPLDGVVLSRNREPGEVLGAGMSVVTIGDLDHLKLTVYVPLTAVETIDLGSPAYVTLDADPEKVHEGKVTWISSEAEFTPRDILTPDERVKQVFAVEISLTKATGLHPGIPADASFVKASK